MTGSWSLLLEPLRDETRPEFEREFPEIPTPDLCALAVCFRLARRENRATPAEIKDEIAAVESAVAALLDRLEGLSDDAKDALLNLTRGQAVGLGAKLPKQLRQYRSALWEADNRLQPTRGAGKGELPRLVAALERLFARHGVTVDASEGGRFVKAVRIILKAAGEPRETGEKLKALSGSVRRALKLANENKGAAAA